MMPGNETSLKIIRTVKRIDQLREDRKKYDETRKTSDEDDKKYNLYCKKIGDAKRRLKKYVEEL